MTNIPGCISLSDKGQTVANVAGVISVIAGLALAILAQMAARYFHTNGVYFFAPGVALAGLALLTLVFVNCCKKAKEEPLQIKDSIKTKKPSVDMGAEGGGQQRPGLPANHSASSNSSRASSTVPRTPLPPSPLSSVGSIDNDDDPRLQAVIAASMEDELAPAISAAEYRTQVGPFDGKKSPQMVAAPRDFRGVYETIRGENQQDPTQLAVLDATYRYVGVKAQGDCLYIAAFAGHCFHMVAKNRFVKTENMLDTECRQHVTKDQHDSALAIIRKIKDTNSLIAFLLNEAEFNEVIQYFRIVVAARLGVPEIKRMARYGEQPEVEELNKLFGGGVCITPEHPTYPYVQECHGVFKNHRGKFLVIQRAKEHFDVLIPQEILGILGLETPKPEEPPKTKPSVEIEGGGEAPSGLQANHTASSAPSQYRTQVGLFDGKKPPPMVAAPRDFGSVYQRIPKRHQNQDQLVFLNPNYRYLVVEAIGDCFYIALIVGLLHHMVATKSFEKVKTKLKEKCKKFVDPGNHKAVLEIINGIKDKNSLIAFLCNQEKFNRLIQYFRRVAAGVTNNPAIEQMETYPIEAEVTTLTHMFDGGVCYTPEDPDYASVSRTHGILGDTPGNFLVIKRGRHFDALIPRKTLVTLGLDTLKAAAAN